MVYVVGVVITVPGVRKGQGDVFTFCMLAAQHPMTS